MLCMILQTTFSLTIRFFSLILVDTFNLSELIHSFLLHDYTTFYLASGH